MNARQPYRDRIEAGQILAAHVRQQIHASDPVVLALPRGGVPVGFEVARELGVPLDVFVVRKLGVPGHEEFAMGAIASGGREVLNHALVGELGITPLEIAAVADRELAELHRREKLYRADRAPIDVRGRTAILVDDGLATGFTMRAAITAVHDLGAQRIAVAVPVGAIETCEAIAQTVDEFVCPLQPDLFQAVGLWYRDFSETSDAEVRECLAAATANLQVAHASEPRPT